MSQVPPETPPRDQRPFFELTLEDIKARAKELLLFLPQFFKNPNEGMKRVPSWDWPTVILLEILWTASTGFLEGIVSRNFLRIIGNVFIVPITSLVIALLASIVIYYGCLFFMKTEVEFRKVFIVVVLAKLLPDLVGILSPLARSPFDFVRIILTAYMLIVGLINNFMLEKKKTVQMVGACTAVALIFWAYSAFTDMTTHRIKVRDYTPESLDQIHKELNDNK